MCYIYYLWYILLSLIFIRFVKLILPLDNGECSRRVFFFREWSVAPYRVLRNGIDRRENKRIAAMSESSRRSFFRNKEWQLQVEPLHRTVQRRQREVLKREAYQPLDTCSINVDATPLFFKFVVLLFLFSIFYCFFEVKLTGTHLYYNYIVVIVIYVLGHLVITRLVLRESRFWWWRPWPLLLHTYVKGFFSKRYEKSLYILILPVNPLFLAVGFFSFFFFEKTKQQYPFYYWRRTILYRLGALGMIILHYALEFFFDNLWVLTTPIGFIYYTLKKILKWLRIALKYIGIDTRKLYARFRYKLSEYSL